MFHLKLDLIVIITKIYFLFSAIFNILDLCRWHSREFFLPIENISSCPDRLKQIASKTIISTQFWVEHFIISVILLMSMFLWFLNRNKSFVKRNISAQFILAMLHHLSLWWNIFDVKTLKKMEMILTLFLLQVCNWHGLCLVDGPPRSVPWPEGGQGLVWFIGDFF